MSSLERELVFLILQFLDEENFKDTVHWLEKESGFFFNMRHFEELVMSGDWEEVESYLAAFTKLHDNRYSMKIYFEIRKQKYLEALDKKNRAAAVEILKNDLKVFAIFNEDLYKEISLLLTLENFRDNEKLSSYGDTKSARGRMLVELKKLIEENPLLRDKLNFPNLNNARLQILINQSLDWQHQLCQNPKPNPNIKTLFVDHTCEQSQLNGERTPSPVTNPLMGLVPKPEGFPPLGAHGPFQSAPAPMPSPLAGLMANLSSVPHPSVSAGPIGFAPANNSAMVKHPKTPPTNNPAVDYQTADTKHVLNRTRTLGISDENGDNPSLVDIKPKIEDITMENSKIWKLTEITEPAQCRSIRLPDNTSSAMRVSRLIYTNSGLGILALAANAIHKFWKWTRNDGNFIVKATTNVIPQLWQPTSGILMANDISDANLDDAVHCIALSKNDSYVVSASGGKISLFSMMTFKELSTFMPPPPTATFLAFHPLDNNIIAIGMEDSSIQIYNVQLEEVIKKIKGHNKQITGLAFSDVLNVLVSAGADSQLCVWNTSGWEIQISKQLQIPAGRVSAPLAETRVQFHKDQTHLLAVHETQIAVYEAPRLESSKQWFPLETSSLITDATYSCDSRSIFVGFEDGSVAILASSTLMLRCRISSAAYLPNNPKVHPLVIAAHPHETDQFALGLSDGGVCVLEPLESKGKWGNSPPLENGAGPSGTAPAAASTADQTQS